MREGRPIRINPYCHIGSTYLSCYFTDKRYKAKDLIGEMDKCRVDLACVSGRVYPMRLGS